MNIIVIAAWYSLIGGGIKLVTVIRHLRPPSNRNRVIAAVLEITVKHRVSLDDSSEIFDFLAR